MLKIPLNEVVLKCAGFLQHRGWGEGGRGDIVGGLSRSNISFGIGSEAALVLFRFFCFYLRATMCVCSDGDRLGGGRAMLHTVWASRNIFGR